MTGDGGDIPSHPWLGCSAMIPPLSPHPEPGTDGQKEAPGAGGWRGGPGTAPPSSRVLSSSSPPSRWRWGLTLGQGGCEVRREAPASPDELQHRRWQTLQCPCF